MFLRNSMTSNWWRVHAQVYFLHIKFGEKFIYQRTMTVHHFETVLLQFSNYSNNCKNETNNKSSPTSSNISVNMIGIIVHTKQQKKIQKKRCCNMGAISSLMHRLPDSLCCTSKTCNWIALNSKIPLRGTTSNYFHPSKVIFAVLAIICACKFQKYT